VPVTGLAPCTLVLAWAGTAHPAINGFLGAAGRYTARTGARALVSVAAA
jgi:hypothetical protein